MTKKEHLSYPEQFDKNFQIVHDIKPTEIRCYEKSNFEAFKDFREDNAFVIYAVVMAILTVAKIVVEVVY